MDEQLREEIAIFRHRAIRALERAMPLNGVTRRLCCHAGTTIVRTTCMSSARPPTPRYSTRGLTSSTDEDGSSASSPYARWFSRPHRQSSYGSCDPQPSMAGLGRKQRNDCRRSLRQEDAAGSLPEGGGPDPSRSRCPDAHGRETNSLPHLYHSSPWSTVEVPA